MVVQKEYRLVDGTVGKMVVLKADRSVALMVLEMAEKMELRMAA